jgi:hypothetical protein
MPVVAMPDGAQVSFPDEMPPDQIRSMILQKFPNAGGEPQGFMANAADFFKSMPNDAAKSFYQSGAGLRGEGEFLTSPFNGGVTTPQSLDIPTGLPTPQGKAGEFGASVGSALGNPVSWMGPGGPILKGVGAVLSALGGKAGEDTGIPGGQFVGSLLGGAAASKTVGAKPVEAAIPTRPELRESYTAHYDAARGSGLKVAPAAVGEVAAQTEQELIREGFDPDTKIFKTLRAVQNAPEGAFVSAQNLDTLRKYFGRAARETNEGKPTESAAQATIALKRFNEFTENIPQDARLAGDAETYVRETKLGNQDYQAAQQLRDAENRTKAATANYEGSIAARLDNQLKAQFRPILKSEAKQRGLTDEQIAAVNDLNKGSFAQRAASQVGRFTPFSPVGFALHAAGGVPSALATGGASILPQMAVGGLIHGARKFGEASSMAQAKRIADLAAKRSDLYQRRKAALPDVDTSGNYAQLWRGGILGLR